MTVIDKISFRFRMADEMFARGLYADWDGFCRHCVTDILDEFFASYDDKETCLEIPVLELDLGSIPQEQFTEVFPVRLREELEKNFLPYKQIYRSGIPESVLAGNAITGRFENLLHYLEHGFCLPGWDREDFDLYEELRKYMDMGYRDRLFSIMKYPHVLARLFIRLDRSQLEKLFFNTADGAGTSSFLSMLFSYGFSLGRYERQRLLSMILETVPRSVVRFIHAANDSSRLDFLAELLENPHIRSIMYNETEGHAEIGIAEYWYRLYGWLLEYYPFNGILMFGDKSHFRIHLNRSLLAFIHKRDSPDYLSKSDITLQFLLEVFGADHYLTVLDIIYHNQRLNKDGSPESGDSYVWELYYILLRLSLLRTGQNTAGHTGRQMSDEKTSEAPGNGQEETLFDEWTAWLLSPSVSDTEKSHILRHYARWRPELLWKLVLYSASETPGKAHVASAQWAAWLGTEDWLEMISGISLSLGSILCRTVGTVSGKYGVENKILAEGLVRFVASYPIDHTPFINDQDIVNKYMKHILELSKSKGCYTLGNGMSEDNREPHSGTGAEDMSEQKAPEEEQAQKGAAQPEYIEVPNAGLCLLAVWFTRLFGLLGLLEEKEDGKRDLKDTEARIRAIFILQRIVTGEPREYKEQDLAFNRIITGCPFYVPLPKTLTLTSHEIQTVESMLSGVKSNWDKLKNTSIKGFQHSFIERPGKLEQREDKWVLYVENRSYDILLDSLPWSYRQIRLPWLKKKINVIWRDKKEFGSDDL